MLIGIVAISRNFAIGKGGKLPWHHKEDLKFFKRTTTGHAVVMGWNTWRSIGRPLPNRVNMVLTRNGQIDEQRDVKVMRTEEDVIKFAHEYERDVFIIGGSKTYESFAAEIEKWFVTEVPIEVPDADTFMPSDFLNGFEQVDKIDLGDELNVRVFQRK